jgi:hypothetical protein
MEKQKGLELAVQPPQVRTGYADMNSGVQLQASHLLPNLENLQIGEKGSRKLAIHTLLAPPPAHENMHKDTHRLLWKMLWFAPRHRRPHAVGASGCCF